MGDIEDLERAPNVFQRALRWLRKTVSLRTSLGATQSRQYWKTSLLVLGGGIVGVVVYSSVYAQQTSAAEGG